jgi:hypothetical protein
MSPKEDEMIGQIKGFLDDGSIHVTVYGKSEPIYFNSKENK